MFECLKEWKDLKDLKDLRDFKEKKNDNTIGMIMAIVGIIVVVAGVAFAVYKFVSKRKAAKKLAEECNCTECEDSLIELEFTYPEEDNTPVENLAEEEE